MSTTIDNSFITLWNKEAKHAYDQETSLLRNTVRVVNGVNAATYKFPVLGSGKATRNKPRHADLEPMNIEHSTKTATLVPVTAMELIDDMDQVRTNIDTRSAYTQSVVGALSRELDQLVIEALALNTNSALSLSNKLDKSALIKVANKFSVNKVPNDGKRFAIISPGATADILSDTTLTSKEYVAQDMLNKGYAESVMGWNLVEHPDLPVDSTSKRTNFFFHQQSVGLAIGKEMKLEISWIPLKQAYAVIGSLMAGAVIIDNTGVQESEISDEA